MALAGQTHPPHLPLEAQLAYLFHLSCYRSRTCSCSLPTAVGGTGFSQTPELSSPGEGYLTWAEGARRGRGSCRGRAGFQGDATPARAVCLMGLFSICPQQGLRRARGSERPRREDKQTKDRQTTGLGFGSYSPAGPVGVPGHLLLHPLGRGARIQRWGGNGI